MSETLLNEPGQTGGVQSAGEGLGESLRRARQQKGLGLEEAGRLVKLQARTLEAIENEDWQALGPEVFVRGHLRSYGRAMQVDVEPFLESRSVRSGRPAAAPLVLKGQGDVTFSPELPSFRRSLAAMPFVWGVLVVALLLAGAWLLLPDSLKPEAAPPVAVSLDALPPPAPEAPAVVSESESEPEPESAAAPVPAAPGLLTLRFKAESWVQIVGADGRTLEQGVLPAGQTRSYASGEVGRLILGNASEVEVQQAGVTVDTTPFRRANVARFAVSSDGSLAPLVD